MKNVIQLDENGYFVSVVQAEVSPLEPNVYLIPAGCIEVDAPIVPENHKAKWNNGWVYEEIPAIPEKPYWHKRLVEYPPMADYLDGVVKGDQAQIDAYIAACQAVKAKYPKV